MDQPAVYRLIDANPDAVLVIDAGGIVRYVNQAAQALFPNRDGLLGEQMDFFVSGDVSEIDILGHASARKGEVRVASIVWEGSPATLATVRDVTESREMAAQLREAQKLETVGLLAGGLAHDFNNLLLVIMGNAGNLSLAMGPDDPKQALLDRVDLASKRARHLVRQLLMFSKKQARRPEPLDTAAGITTLLDMLRRTFPSTVVMEFHAPQERVSVDMDPNEFDQLMINLVFNARQAITREGRIDITLAVEGEADTPCGLARGEYVAIAVSDNGSGIAAEHLPHIFEPFFTTRSSGTGTGLGLAVCRSLVEDGGGNIAVASTEGGGSTFTVRLPRCYDVPALPEVAPQALPRIKGSERVLLVDDDPDVMTVVAQTLLASGFSIVSARSGEDAKSILTESHALIDMVLCDRVMPAMDGRALGIWVKASFPEMPLLFMTAYADEKQAAAVGSDSAPTLLKPFTAIELLSAVRGCLDKPA